MKILILANNDVGLYKFRRELLYELLKKHVVYIALPNGEFIKKLEDIGCKYIDIEFNRRGTNPLHDLKLIQNYMSLIKKIKPDLVITYTIKPTLYGGIVCRLKKTNYIVNITGLGTAVEKSGVLQKLILQMYKISLKKVVCVFFQNKSNMDFFYSRKLIKAKSRLIPGSGVNIAEHSFEEYPETEQCADKFLFIGRIMKDKGIEELFEAAKKIKQEYPKVSFDIVGGSDEDYFSEIDSLEQRGIIKYWNQQSNVHKFLKSCNAVILPSYHEGMANVLLEASSTGRPVLASKIPGCTETFDEGITGFGFEVKDAEDLYCKIRKFVQLSYEKKIKMGISARKKMINEFNRQRVVDAYIEEIKKLEDKGNAIV